MAEQWPRLTARAEAVLTAVAMGESNHEIGRRLGLTEQTIKNHVSVLIEKFRVRNRVQLAVLVALKMPELFRVDPVGQSDRVRASRETN